jgi:catechol 2,3-dioxygenase-like lactoylglutathione lyase family enzyme
MIVIDSIDHVVLTVRDPDATIAFYRDVLGMALVKFEGRLALHFGKQKLNLHLAGHEFEPKAHKPTPGSADLCFLTSVPIEAVVEMLRERKVPIVEGPVAKTGAQGPLRSVYVRDPDQNLIEISNLLKR